MKMNMKKAFLFLMFSLVSIAGPTVMSAQAIHVIYKKQIVPNMNDIPRWFRSGAQKQNYIKEMDRRADNERSYFSLYTDGKNSEFKYDTTIYLKKLSDERGWGRFRGNPEESYSWNTDLKKGISVKRSEDLKKGECFALNFKEEYQWKMGKGYKVFSDMLCSKAYIVSEKGDSTIAWFTRSLPIPAGPEEYGGLPGMILALETPSFIYIAEEVEKTERVVEPVENQGDSCISREEFDEKAWRAFMEKMMRNN